MIRLTLIFTRHKSIGICSSEALLQLMHAVDPEVIFEELSLENYELAYGKQTLNNLEPEAIRKYLSIKPIWHIPVDTYNLPSDYYTKVDFLHSKLTRNAGEQSFHLRNFLDRMESQIYHHGFHFLNSNQIELWFERLEELKEKALEKLKNSNLYEISQLNKDIIEKREEVILDHVYKYCTENEFSRGLMFIGSGHKKSIRKRIQSRIESGENRISWSYYNDLISSLH